MPRFDQNDVDRLRQRADASERLDRVRAQEDVVIDGPRRLLLRAPGGNYFAIHVSDAGALSTVDMGPSL